MSRSPLRESCEIVRRDRSKARGRPPFVSCSMRRSSSFSLRRRPFSCSSSRIFKSGGGSTAIWSGVMLSCVCSLVTVCSSCKRHWVGSGDKRGADEPAQYKPSVWHDVALGPSHYGCAQGVQSVPYDRIVRTSEVINVKWGTVRDREL